MSTRPEIIAELQTLGVEFNPTLRKSDLEKLLEESRAKISGSGKVEEKPKPQPEVAGDKMDELMKMMGTVISKVGDMEKRLSKVEGPTGNEFKTGMKVEDAEKAKVTRKDVDDKVVQIVNEVLGEDFGIRLDTYPDRPGYLFTVIVPTRLSDKEPSTRPVVDPETGEYRVQKDGKTPILEDYQPVDERSRSIGSSQSYDAIREHCNRVRSYIVTYYAKMSKPLPEFKIKQ